MIFKLTPSLNDGKNDAPPREVEFDDEDDCIDRVLNEAYDEMVNDDNQPFGVGFTLTIERVA